MESNLEIFVSAVEAARMSEIADIWELMSKSEKREARELVEELPLAACQGLKRGLYILERETYEKIFGPEEDEKTSDIMGEIFDKAIEIMVEESKEDKIAFEALTSMVIGQDDTSKILSKIKNIDHDIYNDVLLRMPNTTRVEAPFSKEKIGSALKRPKMEEYSDYHSKAKFLGEYYQELIENGLPDSLIDMLILDESNRIDERFDKEAN